MHVKYFVGGGAACLAIGLLIGQIIAMIARPLPVAEPPYRTPIMPYVEPEPDPPVYPERVSLGEHGGILSFTLSTHEQLMQFIAVGDKENDRRLLREGRAVMLRGRQTGTVLEVQGDAWYIAFPEYTGWVADVFLDVPDEVILHARAAIDD